MRLREAQRLRAEVYCFEKDYLLPSALTSYEGVVPDVDDYDEQSRHAGIYCEGELVGTFRVILPGPLPLQVERDFGVETAGRAAEMSRLCVLAPHRNGAAMWALCRWAYDVLIEESIDVAYAELERPLLRHLTAGGFPFTPVGGPRDVYRSVNYPAACRTADIVPGLRARDSGRPFALGAYFSEPVHPDGTVPAGVLSMFAPHRAIPLRRRPVTEMDVVS